MLAHLRLEYFHEFHHSIPLGNNYWAHLWENDAYDSFSEIFIQQEYNDFLPRDYFSKVIDFGANYGYFSLWLQTRFTDRKISSLLIEPSPKCKRSLDNLISQPKLNNQFTFLPKAVANPSEDFIEFFDRSFMAGSIFSNSTNDFSKQVQILSEDEILGVLSPPFDIIKCDIEGSEWHLLKNYSKILSMSKYLIMEWHSWHSGGGGFPQLVECLRQLKFNIIKSSKPSHAIGREGEVGLFLAKNLRLAS